MRVVSVVRRRFGIGVLVEYGFVVVVEYGFVVVVVTERRADELDVVGAQLRIDGGVDPCALERGDCLLELLGQQLGAIALERESVERLPAPDSANQGVAIHNATIIDAVAAKANSATAILVGASAAQAAVSFVAVGLPAIGPELRRAFALSLPELGAVLTASLFGSGLALLAAGVAVDRFGPRAAMLVGTPLASGGLVAASLVSSKPLLFGALVVSGIGSAVVPVAGTGALFQAFPASRRGWALGVRQMAVPLGGTVAAVTLPLLDAVGGVRLPLLVAAAAVASSGIAFAAVSSSEVVPRRPTARAFRRILAAPGMLRLLAVASLYILVLQALLTFAVPSIRAAGFSRLSASIAFAVINVTAMGARLVWGRIADLSGGTRRSRTLTEIGLVAAGGGLGFAVSLHTAAPVVTAAAILFAFGAMGWNAIVYVSAGERTTPELASRSVALALTVVFLVSAVSTPLLGALANRAGWSVFWLVTVGLALAGAGIAGTLADTRGTD